MRARPSYADSALDWDAFFDGGAPRPGAGGARDSTGRLMIA